MICFTLEGSDNCLSASSTVLYWVSSSKLLNPFITSKPIRPKESCSRSKSFISNEEKLCLAISKSNWFSETESRRECKHIVLRCVKIKLERSSNSTCSIHVVNRIVRQAHRPEHASHIGATSFQFAALCYLTHYRRGCRRYVGFGITRKQLSQCRFELIVIFIGSNKKRASMNMNLGMIFDNG